MHKNKIINYVYNKLAVLEASEAKTSRFQVKIVTLSDISTAQVE
jgi:hypothetical protein